MKKSLSLILFLMMSLHISNARAQFYTEDLSPNVKVFIAKMYKPDTRKKLVLHTFDSVPDCPYGRMFYDAFNEQMNKDDLKNSYVFQKKITSFSYSYSSNDTYAKTLVQGFDELGNKCGFFCIIDMNDNWFYSIGNSVGIKEALILPLLFEELKYK